jgi:Flp pilus assembly protein TadG
MNAVKNERGSVIIFITLMVVLLLILIGMGLDSGQLAYVRSQGQPAVDAAALAAASAIPTNDPDVVISRATKFNSANSYLDSTINQIGAANVTLIHYDPSQNPDISAATGVVSGASTGTANGVRVALENSSNNPYGGNAGAPMLSPLFLMPLANLFGIATPATAPVNVSAVAVIKAVPGLPIAVADSSCGSSTVTLDFDNSGSGRWTTYYQSTTSANVGALFDGLPTCSGQPPVDVGFCANLGDNTKLSPGMRDSLFKNTLPNIFASNSGCYLLPVVKAGDINASTCAEISGWAKFCPDSKTPLPSNHEVKGSVTCGQSIYTSRDTRCYVPSLIRDKLSGM